MFDDLTSDDYVELMTELAEADRKTKEEEEKNRLEDIKLLNLKYQIPFTKY